MPYNRICNTTQYNQHLQQHKSKQSTRQRNPLQLNTRQEEDDTTQHTMQHNKLQTMNTHQRNTIQH